jgi:exodeoxyribonuclease VIII
MTDLLLGRPLGIHNDVPESEYHAPAFGVVSKSALDAIVRSPAHYLHWHTTPREPTDAMLFGRAFHCAALEPERFATAYVVKPEFGDQRTPANKARRLEWEAQNAGSEAISAAWRDKALRMAEVLRAHPLVSRMLVGGQSEVTVTWRDEQTGLPCKSRADYYVPQRAMVVDLKSTADASPDAFRKSIANYRYHVQDALYRDAFRGAGAPIQHFVMVAVEKEGPHGVAVYSLDAESIAMGYGAARQGIDALAHAVKTDDWRGYPAQINTVELPPWAA